MATAARGLTHRAFWWSLAVACLVAGTRLLLVSRWGGDGPYLDECNQTGIFHIWAGQGQLSLARLTGALFEHRLITQRLYSLGLAWANGGQWDVRVELVASACLWGVFAGALTAFGVSSLRGWAVAAWAVFVFLAEAIPHAWENLLWAFQVQFLFLVGFTVFALWLVPRSKALSPPWWLGLLCGIAACATQAAGLLVWPVLLLAVGARCAFGRANRDWRSLVGIALLGMALLGALWANARTNHQDTLHANSLGIWWPAFTGLMAWPWSASVWVASVMWLPSLLYLAFSRRDRPSSSGEWGLALVVWAVLQAASAAWARGAMLVHGLPPSRYADTLIIGVLGNCLLLLSWAQCMGQTVALALRRWVAVAWMAAALAGLGCYLGELTYSPTMASQISLISLADFISSREIQAEAFRAYGRTGNPKVLDTKPIIYPVDTDLAAIVDSLRGLGRWPATLSGHAESRLPVLSWIARRAGYWGWGVIGLGVFAVVVACRSQDDLENCHCTVAKTRFHGPQSG